MKQYKSNHGELIEVIGLSLIGVAIYFYSHYNNLAYAKHQEVYSRQLEREQGIQRMDSQRPVSADTNNLERITK